MSEKQTADALEKKLGAFLYIVGGEEMVRAGYVDFGDYSMRLTQKGCALMHAVIDRIPSAARVSDGAHAELRTELQTLSDAADALNGDIGQQTYYERVNWNWDFPAGHEFKVALRYDRIFALNRAIFDAKSLLSSLPQAEGRSHG